MRLGALLFLAVAACEPADDAGGRPAGSSADEPEAAVREPGGAAGAATAAGSERLRVLFLGTSLTSGLGLLRDDERYTARLQALADSAGLPVTMVNAGVSGETSAGGLRRLDRLLDEQVDVLVLETGANDGLRGHDPESLESNLRAMIREARERRPGVRVVLVGMEAPPNMGQRYVRRFRAVFPEVAEETDAALVPFLLEGVAGVPGLNQGDGIHPTAAGHLRMARNVWPVLEPVLQGALDERPAAARDGSR